MPFESLFIAIVFMPIPIICFQLRDLSLHLLADCSGGEQSMCHGPVPETSMPNEPKPAPSGSGCPDSVRESWREMRSSINNVFPWDEPALRSIKRNFPKAFIIGGNGRIYRCPVVDLSLSGKEASKCGESGITWVQNENACRTTVFWTVAFTAFSSLLTNQYLFKCDHLNDSLLFVRQRIMVLFRLETRCYISGTPWAYFYWAVIFSILETNPLLHTLIKLV